MIRELLPGLSWTEARPTKLKTLRSPAVPLKTLRRVLANAQRPVFLVNDAQRIQWRGLPEVLAELWDGAGQPPILVATGTHTADPTKLVDRLNGLPVEVHEADAPHAALGEGDDAVGIDRRVARADVIMAFGVVEPHYFAGWSGAHKTATVGVMDRESIQRNHRNALSAASQPLALEGNPVFDDLARVLTLLEEDRRVLAVNHVLDEHGAPLGMATGTWRGSLRRAVKVAERRYLHTVPEPVDVLVARVAGPLGRTLYQADKGLKNNEAAVKDGGDLILETDLDRGVGPDRFLDLLRRAPDAATAHSLVGDEYVLGDHKAVRWRDLEARGVRIRIVSSQLSPEDLEGTGIELHPDLGTATKAMVLEGRGQSGVGLLVEDAGLLVTQGRPE